MKNKNDVNRQDLIELTDLLNNWDKSFNKRDQTNYAEEDENGVVWIKNKDEVPLYTMSKKDYIDILTYKVDEK